MVERKLPNVLITGTPGTGKTSTSLLASQSLGLKYINVGDFVKEKGCHEGRDEEFDTFMLDEDKLCDELESVLLQEGGYIVDFHSPEIFPEEWFDLIIVLRTSTEQLFDRLTARGYDDRKRGENMECEIMQVVLESVREHFDTDMIQELSSDTVEEMESNVQRLKQWFDAWKQHHILC